MTTIGQRKISRGDDSNEDDNRTGVNDAKGDANRAVVTMTGQGTISRGDDSNGDEDRTGDNDAKGDNNRTMVMMTEHGENEER